MKDVKKYDLKEINIRLNNLKKILGDRTVEEEINFQSHYSDNWCDVLNLAYRFLKNRYTKIQRHKYGFIRLIDYEVKQRKKLWTLSDKIIANGYYGYPIFNSNSSSTITTSNNYVW